MDGGAGSAVCVSVTTRTHQKAYHRRPYDNNHVGRCHRKSVFLFFLAPGECVKTSQCGFDVLESVLGILVFLSSLIFLPAFFPETEGACCPRPTNR